MSFFKTIRERKLVQWTASYVAGAWALVEVVQALRDGGSSPWFRLFLIALGLGLLITTVLAWYHGEKGRQRVSGAELVIIASLLAVAAVLIRLVPIGPVQVDRASPVTEDADPREEAPGYEIAVLPFRAIGAGRSEEALAAGLHRELISQLRKIRDLNVKSASSVLEYEGRPASVRTVGEELGAAYVVDADLQSTEDRIRIAVALNDAGSERILWDDDFDIERNPDRILSTQREIALRVATTIGAQILPAERNRLDVDPPTSVEAFDLYMEGLYHLRGVTLGAGDLDRAVEALESATTVDPMWPPAHAALGAALHWLGTSGVPGSVAILQRSRAESEQALALDSAYAPAWASLGFALAVGDRDFPAADAAYREAARLGGAEPRGHAFVLRLAGRWEEALGMYARAIAQDPRSTVLLANAGHAHFCSRDYRGAIDLYERARNIRPEAVASDVRRALAQLELGLTDEASAEADRLWSNRGANNVRAESLALLYARLGSTTRAEELLDESDRQTRLKEFAFGAAAALELDDPERALDYIEQLGMQRRAADQLLCLDFSAVAHDERFREALRRGGVAAGAEYSGRAP